MKLHDINDHCSYHSLVLGVQGARPGASPALLPSVLATAGGIRTYLTPRETEDQKGPAPSPTAGTAHGRQLWKWFTMTLAPWHSHFVQSLPLEAELLLKSWDAIKSWDVISEIRSQKTMTFILLIPSPSC